MKLFSPAALWFTFPATSLRGLFVSVASSRRADLAGLSGLLSLIAMCVGLFVHQAKAGAASSTYPYTVTVIPGLPPAYETEFQPQAINDNGEITGADNIPNVSDAHAFLWSNNTYTDLGSLINSKGSLADYSWPYAINSSGEVVGISAVGLNKTTHARTFHAVIFHVGSKPTDLGVLNGTQSFAYGVNDSGQVVGNILLADHTTRAFLYQNKKLTNLGAPIPNGTSSAAAINKYGLIVGGADFTGGYHAFTYSGGRWTDLGAFGLTGSTTFANAVNSAGWIVGWFKNANGGHGYFLYKNGQMTDLRFPAVSEFGGLGINDLGHIIANSQLGTGTFAYLYKDGAWQALTNLIDPSAGWTVEIAACINNSDEIVAYLYNSTSEVNAIGILVPSP